MGPAHLGQSRGRALWIPRAQRERAEQSRPSERKREASGWKGLQGASYVHPPSQNPFGRTEREEEIQEVSNSHPPLQKNLRLTEREEEIQETPDSHSPLTEREEEIQEPSDSHPPLQKILRLTEREEEILETPSGYSPLQNLSGRTERRGRSPVAGGGFADIWSGILSGYQSRTNTQAVSKGTIHLGVAVKVLRTAQIYDNWKVLKDSLRELSIWHMVSDHPHVLPLLGFSSEDGCNLSMVCPWMDNGTLHDYLDGAGKLWTEADRYRILRQVGSALAHVHSHSIVHGDLSCTNILIDDGGDAYLADFGLSTAVAAQPPFDKIHAGAELPQDSDASMLQCEHSQLVGNYRFMAPELFCLGSDTYTGRTFSSDIYALGGIILQTLTGMKPHHTMKILMPHTMKKQLAQGVLPFQRTKDSPIISDDQWELLCGCWAKQPTDRPALLTIMQCLQHPDNRYTSDFPVLPHRTDLEVHGTSVKVCPGGIIRTVQQADLIIRVLHALPYKYKDNTLQVLPPIALQLVAALTLPLGHPRHWI
ncbi:hypothetical protein EYR36_008335 [Pleurotus pulmonarius]|nr:hypothetical protein EYR36_008335 [Pleurotus pulmonarius]